MANVLYCSFLSTPACNCCINDLHRAAPKRHFAPPGPNGRTLQVFFHTPTAADTPHRVSCDAYGASDWSWAGGPVSNGQKPNLTIQSFSMWGARDHA